MRIRNTNLFSQETIDDNINNQNINQNNNIDNNTNNNNDNDNDNINIDLNNNINKINICDNKQNRNLSNNIKITDINDENDFVNYCDDNFNNNIISETQNIFENIDYQINYIHYKKNSNLNDYQNNSLNINLNNNGSEINININERDDNININPEQRLVTNIIVENVNSNHINLNNAYLTLPGLNRISLYNVQTDSFFNNEIENGRRNRYRYILQPLLLESFNSIHENRNKLVDNLLEYELNKVEKLEEGNKKCVICLEHFKDGDKIISLPCVHIYHGDCIKKWLLRTNFCPICKYTFNDDELNN